MTKRINPLKNLCSVALFYPLPNAKERNWSFRDFFRKRQNSLFPGRETKNTTPETEKSTPNTLHFCQNKKISSQNCFPPCFLALVPYPQTLVPKQPFSAL
jgi:hypothetical protein